jgi:hypothetical protein
LALSIPTQNMKGKDYSWSADNALIKYIDNFFFYMKRNRTE